MNTELPAPAGTNYLLAIAIDKYVHLPRLYNCRRDAEALIQLLTKNYSFEPANVTALFDAEATHSQIDAVFDHLIDRVTTEDNLVIYYSGHGEYYPKRKEGYWIPVDAEEGIYRQYLPNDTIRRFLGLINSRHTFLISDSCFAGSLFAKGAMKNISKRYERDPSRWGLTAGRNEIVSDGKPGMHSPFADALLFRLQQNEDAMGVSELCAYVVEQVQAHAHQSPVGEPLRVEGHKNGQFVFRKKVKASATQVSNQQEGFAWQIARSAHSFAGYQEYLRLFPNGAHYLEAIDLLGQSIGKAEAPPTPAPVVQPSKPRLVLPEMVLVKGGTFMMGCTEEQGGGWFDIGKPAHEVSVKDFKIGKYPVTQAEWKAVMGKNPSHFAGCDHCPVEKVSWDDVQEFFQKLNQLTGQNFRLPTEAEWEYAARGGNASKGFKYAGSNDPDEVAWSSNNAASKTHPVGKKKPNELGLYDMSGNVLEWCADQWHHSYNSAPSDGSAWVSGGDGFDRVLRGGSWNISGWSCRVSDRLKFSSEGRYNVIGFRLAQD